MKLLIQFGAIDSKEVSWYKALDDFPKIIKHLDKPYEWVFYSTDLTGKVDMILTFGEIPSYDPMYHMPCPSWKELFESNLSTTCDCGAKYTSFPWDHMKMCKLWTKW
jgi:hypothetical protein